MSNNINNDRDPLPAYIDGENMTRMMLNPDREKVESVIKEIYENNGWCPSKTSCLNGELIPDFRCPCPDFMILGKCECGLFVHVPMSYSPDKMPTKNNQIDWSSSFNAVLSNINTVDKD